MTRTWKRLGAPAAAITAAALLAACSSSSSSSSSAVASSSATPSSSASASASSSASAGSAGVAAAQAMIATMEAAPSHPVPGAPIKGVSSLKGKTVYYVPLVQQIPGFILTAAALKTALSSVGVKLQICNGEAQPSAVAACIGQATGAGAAGIILDSIPQQMAANSISSATAKGVPVIVSDQLPPTPTAKSTDKLDYALGAPYQPNDIAYWTIADSGGAANLIIAEEADSPSAIQYIVNSQAIYKQDCPNCKVVVKQISQSDAAQWASATSSFLLSNPNANYYYTEFEDSLQAAIQGIQTSNRTSINLAVAGGSTDGLGLLAKGSGPVKAVVAVDQTYAGWALADQILRMATKTAPVSVIYPTRLFTKANIGSIQVTAAAEAAGSWFGSDAYQAAFKKDWGV
jgi:ribose transport system substrate-binding protein